MPYETEKVKLMHKYFPKCPICESERGYELSTFYPNVKCKSCKAEWLLFEDGMKLKWQSEEGWDKELLNKKHSFQFWKTLKKPEEKLVEEEYSPVFYLGGHTDFRNRTFCELNDLAIPKHINFNKWTRQPQKLPWVPLEREVDALIAGCSRKVATFLQTLKETGMRCGEAWRLEWTDVDTEHNVITMNNPEKHGVPRQLKISAKLVAMLNGLPKKSERVFASSTLAILRCNFMTQRKKIAFKLKNPRLRRITFHTLRHFKGTMEYHKTKDILHVKELLGHRKISSTLVYTHLVNFESDDYTVRVAKTLREDEELLKAGFEYVTERENLKIYRKRK